jgi:N-acetylglucosamine repressor
VRKIDIQDFRRATRDTPRAVNRRIILNLLREHGPLSRADLARSMDVPRGMITALVNELLHERLVLEGATTSAPRGRRPTLLHLRSHDRLALGVDVRASRTVVHLTDFAGHELARDDFSTPEDPRALSGRVVEAAGRLLEPGRRRQNVEGVGVVIPGMVDPGAGVILNAPTLGWRDVSIRRALIRDLGVKVPIHVERDAVACALGQIWLCDSPPDTTRDFVYMVVSEGVGTGLVVNGQPVRGRHFTAGEFGHVPLDPAGPPCSCGARGCLEAYTSDAATVARFLGIEFAGRESTQRMRESGPSVSEVVSRAREGDREARRAMEATGRYMGTGLAVIINALDPARIVVGGALVAGWEMIEPLVRENVQARTLTAAAARTPIDVDPDYAETRLQGAAALVVAPAFAAPRIA